MKHTIRIMTLMATLLFSMAVESWALSDTDIKFATIQPVPEAGTVKVKEEGGVVGRKVTIVATPATNYYIEKSGIVVQKLVSPSRMAPRRRAPQLTDTLGVSGPAESSVAAEYTFVIPEDYDGALVTVTFTGKDPATADIKLPTLYYNTEAQELIQSAAVTGGTIKYTLTENAANEQYSETIPTGTNAQEYTVYYKVFPDDEHSATLGHVKVKILPAPLTQATWQQSAQNHTGSELTFSLKEVKAGELTVPAATGYTLSGNKATAEGSYTATITGSGNFSGTLKLAYRIVGSSESIVVIDGSTTAASISARDNKLSATYILAADIDASILAGLQSGIFTGELDGDMHKISNVSHALFSTLTGTVKNVMLEKVKITTGTDVGAFANEASGSARIYNCGVLDGSISGSAKVGGLVGLLDGEARVINCFSYADINGGADKGGIVGYNNVATTSANLKTMVMNCMFYGNIAEGGKVAPIYGGTNISNVGDKGVNNFNYFRAEAPYVQNQKINVYNCALMAETRFLQRFEFFRHLLNGHRELAAWWATGDMANKDQMMKWVMAPDSIGTAHPYPILLPPGKYPSVVNINAEHAAVGKPRNQGGKLGTLKVNIRMGDGAVYTHPGTGENEAKITISSLDLNITDKDTDHFNFNYYKVQLPYYNDVGTKNYTGNRVVTGWKIVGMDKTSGSFTTGSEATATITIEDGKTSVTLTTPFNFADRKSTAKDIYSSTNKRVFNQGAYFDVPEGVTEITIEPYWAKAAYLADAYMDVVYKNAMANAVNVPNVGGGQKYINNNDYNIAGESQKVYTAIGDAVTALEISTSNTVYDYALVLVGNYHHIYTKDSNIGGSSPYTICSIDLDQDNEPDYSYILRYNGRCKTHPVRVDFLNMPGLGMAQKSSDSEGSYNFGILRPMGWFESTNTSLFRVTQFEYDASGRGEAPLILQGGVMEQWVSSQNSNPTNNTIYYHVGGNVWFKEFHRGTHQDDQYQSKHPPISVTGGDFDEFYLTGLYRSDVANYSDDAECYINGGRFGIVAGAGQEGIGDATKNTGNIIWQIDNADIREFYGGGINKNMVGNITTVISNSHVDQFCGGPKFGDMASGKTVVTQAKGCTFGTYFGAGYGGNAYSRKAPKNYSTSLVNMGSSGDTPTWNGWVTAQYKQEYEAAYSGVSAQFSYQFLPLSDNTTNVSRIFIEYVKFSLATTRNVTSMLDGCTVTGNFYGGGSLGKVVGSATSSLSNCMVRGHVFGAGYSASLPPVEVDSIGFRTEPYYYESLGAYRTGVKGATTTYTWKHRDEVVNSTTLAIDKTNHILYTNEDLNTLGTVEGLVTLNIEDGTTVAGNVFGGGESSNVAIASSATNKKNVIVNINGGSMTNVYGGGSMANVGGNTEVNLKGGTIAKDVYGGGKGDAGHEATVGQTLVKLNEPVVNDKEEVTYPYTCVVNGRIFGCNDVNGYPTDTATVHIYKTYGASRTDQDHLHDINDNNHKYHLKAVYGGGNLAPYKAAAGATHVIIDGCGMTSIQTVYGGGNAASTPATQVDVNGTYEIEEVFGGGNGKDAIGKDAEGNDIPNPGANVGYHAYPDDADYDTRNDLTEAQKAGEATCYTYGTGEAHVNIYGGLIHRVFGGSNTKGNVRQIAVTLLDGEVEGCDFSIDEAYGGGKSAPMDGASKLEMACIPGLKVAYGGAEEANINNDVTLNITNGTFDRVFGGNNVKGTISGKITVNIEETGCRPIIIGQLYGGGNQAPYTAKNVEDGPTLNIRSFTSIGDVFGGGYGKTAVVTGDTHVNINVCKGRYADYETDPSLTGNHPLSFTQYQRTTEVTADNPDGFVFDADKNRMTENITIPDLYLPPHASGKIGGINRVYGGGNQAEVIGDTHVYIGTTSQEIFATPASALEADRTHKVDGVNILGNVYGGGNQANVTGRTNVVIGKQIVAPTSQGSDDQGEGNQDGN